MNALYVIPARGGSKGIPHKNIKPLDGKPLICYSIDVARQMTSDDNICVTTDDEKIIEVVENYGLKVPFVRPAHLAEDGSGTYEVLLHAVDFYKKRGKNYDVLVLLQPTSPFRTVNDIKESMSLYSNDIDMVVSVKEAAANPYYNCFEENKNGFLEHSKGDGDYNRRQDVPKAWQYNGAVYVININSLLKSPLSKFEKVRKYEMDDIHSIDFDTMLDWKIAEVLLKERMI